MNKNQRLKLYLFYFYMVSLVLAIVLLPRLSLPLIFSYFLYSILVPLKNRMTIGSLQKRLFYFFLFTVLLFSFFLPFIFSFSKIETNFESFSTHLYNAQSNIQTKLNEFKSTNIENKKIIDVINTVDPVKFIVSHVENFTSEVLSYLPHLLSRLFEWILLVPLFLYFFFKESDQFKKEALKLVPNVFFEKFYVLIAQFNMKFSSYILAKFIEATLLTVIVSIGLLLIDYPYPYILGFFAGMTNIVPYLGPIAGYIPALLIGFLSKDATISILGMTLVFLIANLVDIILVFPMLVSKIVNLHPIVVILSIIVGSQLGGIVGMIVVIPLVAFFKLLFYEIHKDLTVDI